MKFIEDMHLKNKTVLLRCDYNVPINDGIITDDSKIVKSLKTINYLLDKNCKIIILSHLGRVKTEEDKLKNTLKPVATRLEELLNEEVTFVSDAIENGIPEDKRIILLENTRFFDYPEKKESANDLDLAKEWAKLADIFIFDAFGSAHRAHASTAGISRYLPTGIGYLVEEELNNLEKVQKNPKKPFVVIMGGAKVDDKIPLIKTLLHSCDNLLLGGGIANSFIKAKGINVGKSLATDDDSIIEELKMLLELYKDKILLPVDARIKNNESIITKSINAIEADDSIYDIGGKTINKYASIINEAETIFMNGTMGLFEDKEFQKGTLHIFEELIKVPVVVIGGGDTVAAVNLLGFTDNFILSSGGGASLEYIAKGKLDALEEIERYDNEKISL